MENQQPEALVLASLFERCVIAFGETETSSRAIAAKELRRLHARVQELEAMLDAVGAGGVSAQRITQQSPKDHIQRKPEPFGYFKAEPFGWRDCAETDDGAIALYDAPQPPVPSGMRLVNAGALQMVINALRRDAEEGKAARGEMADELLATGGQPQADAGDAGRYLDYLIHNQARVLNNLDEYEGDEDDVDCGYWLEWTDDKSQVWVQIGIFKTPRDAIEAAIAAAKESR